MVMDAEMEQKLKEHREQKQTTATTKDVEPADLEKLKNLQADMDNLVVAFGQVAIQEAAMVAQKEQLETALKDIKTKETTLAAELSKKYGEGSLDLSTGKFSSSR